MAKRERKYRWFVGPEDALTNEAIADELPGQTIQEFNDNNGCARKVWECPRSLINTLHRNMTRLNLRFEVFCMEGRGALRSFPFPRKEKKRKVVLKKASTGEPVTI